MDKDRDYDQFAKLIDETYALISAGKSVLPAGAKVLFFRAMERYPIQTVRGAINAHIQDAQRGQYLPKPADLIFQIEGAANGDGRPGADEAWALALSAQDENETVIWTSEMAQAFAIAQAVLKTDEIGARVAFRDAYNRLVDAARRAGQPAKWEISQGFDKQRRELAIQQAVIVGRLPAPPAALRIGTDVKPEEIDRSGIEKVKEACRALVPGSEKARIRAEAERQAEAEKKRQIAEQVANYQVSGRHKRGVTA